MLEIRTNFTPFKMKLTRREPVTLSIEMKNIGDSTEIVSFDVDLGNYLSFEKGGFKTTNSDRIMEFGPGQSKKYYLDIWPKQVTNAGEATIMLKATEHYNNLNYVKKKYEKALKLSIDE